MRLTGFGSYGGRPAPPRRIAILGVPLEWGANKPGAAGGPRAIRAAGLRKALDALSLRVVDMGDMAIAPRRGRNAGPRPGTIKNEAEVLDVSRRLAERTYRLARAGDLPLILGGDHSLSMGSVAGVARALRERRKRLGMIWVDAHPDMNTPETTPSGNAHGMPTAHLMGMGDPRFARLAGFSPAVRPTDLSLIGLRDVDAREGETLKRAGVGIFTMHDLDRLGMGATIGGAIERASRGTGGFHLSFDIDACDPEIAPGTATPCRGGLTYREAHLLMEMAYESGKLVSLEVAEVNPRADVGNKTSSLAVELIASALGKKIY